MNAPHSTQNSRLGRFAFSQLQHISIVVDAGAVERSGARGADAGSDAIEGWMGDPESSR